MGSTLPPTLLFGYLSKADPTTPAFTVTGAGTISVKAGTEVAVGATPFYYPAATAVTMPSLAAGTDYAIYQCSDGSILADASFTAPSGYTTANSRQIGGFHYAPGGNAAALSKIAVAAGTAIGAQTVTANKWALYLLSINSAGAITVTPAAGNVAGYSTEALAIAALPTTPALQFLMGYITVLTASGLAWIAGTDALAGGSSGNPATTTNYYPNSGSGIGLTLARGSVDTAIANTAFTYVLGGNTTPAINPYSVWDIKFRPRCVDPRGMALVAGRFWCDIYLTNTATDANGSSRYGLAICSGGVPPKIPAAFGGNGSTAYGEFNWWDANEVVASVGKRLLTTAEFQIAAYGTTEESSCGSDPGTTGLQGGTYTSKWGLFQATGCYWVWGLDLGGPYSASSWTQSTGNRGQFFDMPNAVLLGGNFGNGPDSGSRASNWEYAASISGGNIGARGCADHIMIA
jgi:hypothetical protein